MTMLIIHPTAPPPPHPFPVYTQPLVRGGVSSPWHIGPSGGRVDVHQLGAGEGQRNTTRPGPAGQPGPEPEPQWYRCSGISSSSIVVVASAVAVVSL